MGIQPWDDDGMVVDLGCPQPCGWRDEGERRQNLKEHLSKHILSVLVLVETQVEPHKEH